MKYCFYIMAILGGSMAFTSAFSTVNLYCHDMGATDDYYCYNYEVCTDPVSCNDYTDTAYRCSDGICPNTGFFTDDSGNTDSDQMKAKEIEKYYGTKTWIFYCAEGVPMSPTHNKYWKQNSQKNFSASEYDFGTAKYPTGVYYASQVEWINKTASNKKQRPNWMACSGPSDSPLPRQRHRSF